MKLEQHEFTGTLKGKIMEAERKFAKLCEDLNRKYKPIAEAKNSAVEMEWLRSGHDSFSPYYLSEIKWSLSRNGHPPEVHRLVIWECTREFLGFPVRWNLPGSKVVGEFLADSYEQTASKLEKQLASFLQ